MSRADAALRERLGEVLAPIAAGHGLHLEQVEVVRSGRRSLVRVTLDLLDGPGALSLDSLADVSQEISGRLDETSLLPGAYTLEVSTPGTDRPLREPRHFRRAQNRLVAVTTRDGGALVARLLEADDAGIVLRPDGGQETTLAYADIASARVEVELRPLSDDEEGDV